MDKPQLGVIGPKPFDPRDRVLAPLAAAPGGIDWAAGSGVKPPPTEDQGTSGSCTEQMLGYMFWINTQVQLSRRDGYSKIHQPGGGAFMDQPFYNLRKDGQYTRDQGFPEPSPQTEQNMTTLIVSDVNRKKWVVSYWRLTDTTMEGVARAIQAYKCVGAAFNVQWDKWADYEHPEPNDPNEQLDGSHALCLYDFGMAAEPYIKAMSSWGSFARYHEFKKNYFQPGKSYDFYVMEVGELMPDMPDGFVEVINNNGKIGVVQYIDTPENLLYQGKLHKFAVPIVKDNDGKPVLGADGHIQVKWAEMPIKKATIN